MEKGLVYEDVLKWAGEMGVYQGALFLYMTGFIFISVESLYMNFIGYRMDHWCKVPELASLPFDIQKHVAIPSSSDSSDGYESCEMFNLNYSKYDIGDFLNWTRLEDEGTKACSDWVFDQSIYPENIVNEWQLVCGKSWQIDLVSTLTMAGSLVGAMAGGALSDRFGRVRTMSCGMVLKVAANVLSTLAPNYVVFAIARFFIGLGSTVPYMAGFVLAVENAGPAHRPWLGMAYSIFFSIGFAFIPLFALACRNWRNLQIVMTAPTFIYLFTIWFVPESPRWLLSRGRLERAEKGIHQIAVVNNRHLPDDFKITDIKMDERKEGNATFLDLFNTPKIRRYTLIQAVIWFSVNLIYYALSLNAGTLAGDIFLNTALLGLVEVPAGILCSIGMKIKFLGRKRTVAFSAILGGVACVICVPIIIVDEGSVAVTALSMIGKAGATAAFNGVYVYTAEIYPTEVRNVGLGTCSTAARVSSLIAPYVGGLFGELWAPLPSLIFGVVGTLSGLLTFLLPETFGKSLPETVDELENGILNSAEAKTEVTEAENDKSPSINGHINGIGTEKISDSEKKGIEGLTIENAYHNVAFSEKF